MLVTGMHTVRDAFCQGCDARLGWKYGTLRRARVRNKSRAQACVLLFGRAERAYEPSQRYKVGCFILEKTQVQPEFAD